MRSINVPKKTFEKFEELKLPNDVVSTESKLYIYNFRGSEKLVKKLYRTNGEYFATKLYTVAMLDESREFLPDNFVLPDYTFSINHDDVGFTIPKIDGITLSTILNNSKINPREQIGYLKQIGETLNQLEGVRRNTGLDSIYLNDINEFNFIIDSKSGKLYVIDLDSAKIENNKIFPARYLSKTGILANTTGKYLRNESAWNQESASEYELKNRLAEGYFIPSSNTDLYCFIIIILNYLYGDNINNFTIDQFYEYLNYLSYIGVNRKLVDCFANLVDRPDNYNPSEYLDLLSEENIYRARQKIYKINQAKGINIVKK